MPWNMYDIRAEYPDNQYKDFQVGGETLHDARQAADRRINIGRDRLAVIEWRGQVAFVDRTP